MTHSRTRTSTLAAVALVALLLTGCGSTKDKAGGDATRPIELLLAHHDSSAGGVQDWADAVQRVSKGTMTVTVRTGWRAGGSNYERGMIDDVRARKVDLGSVAARAFDEVDVTSLQPLEAPLLIDSQRLESSVLGGPIARKALAGTSKIGLTGLALLPGEPRRPVGISRVLREPADFQGARIYTREGAVARATLDTLGAEPVHLPLSDWFKGTDGAEIGLSALHSEPAVARRTAGLTANVVLWPQLLTIVMNAEAFGQLTPAQQKVLQDASRQVLAPQTELVRAIAADDLSSVCRLGVKLVTATSGQLEALRTAVAPVNEMIERGPGNREALAAIRALKRNATADMLPCPDSAQAKLKPTDAGRLVGTYQTSIAEKQLRDSPLLMDTGEINDENWGDFTLRLSRDGRMHMIQRNARDESEMRGTHSIKGDVVTFDVESLGETFVVKWSLYRDKLRFTRDHALGIAPTPFLIQAYERAGS